MPSRAKLSRTAPGFTPRRLASISPRVAASSGTCSVTKSAGPQDLLDRMRLAHLRGQPPRGVDGDLRVVADDLHAELDRRVGDQAADRAEADDAERALRQLDAGELLLPLLDARFEVRRRRPRRARDELQRRNQVARRDQHRGEHQLLDRVRVRARRVEHRHAARGSSRHRDVVGAGPGAPDRLDGRRNRHRVHVVRAHQDRVGRSTCLPTV